MFFKKMLVSKTILSEFCPFVLFADKQLCWFILFHYDTIKFKIYIYGENIYCDILF